uniref:Uncharacterized protein n=1 Tax=Aplanochytrium stocchinoi TaxID=215587 RepID=A0A7S3LGJ2_9STRA|mmetsp:Transcript_29595/g.36575  ORF Transcript_29595/g.36575 Transcript_29595/m.36575 type:complete len:166 (-) Transcript_29595:439-936(-)
MSFDTVQEYTEGIDGFPFDENGKPAVIVIPHPNTKQQETNILAVLFSNRAAGFTALARYDLAYKDAEMCILLEAKWSKGYVRKGKALLGLHRYKEAATAYSKAVECESSTRAQEKERHDREIECLCQQNETNNKAYLNLMDKVKMLETQLDDYKLVFGSAGKKQA